MGYLQRYFPSARRNVGGAKSQENSSAQLLPQKGATSAARSGHNQLYTLTNHQEMKVSPDVVTSTFQIFSHKVYVLLDLESTLSYMTPYVVVGFGFEPDMIAESFSVSTLVGDSVVARKVYKFFFVSIISKDTMVDLIELDMVTFDAILGID